jgi:multiple sugar transport system permease protein
MNIRKTFAEDRSIKYLLLLPVLVWIVTFTLYPLLYAVRISLYKETLSGVKFVGLANFTRVFLDPRFWNDLRVTFTFVGSTVAIELLIGFGLALLLNEDVKGKRFFQVLFTIPLFACPVAISYIGLILFNEEDGIINFMLSKVLHFGKVSWLSDPSVALLTCVLLNSWQWISFVFLVLTAGLQSLPREPLEAAVVDGATGWQVFRYITLPLLKPVIVTTLLFKLVYSFKVFDIPFNLTEGGPGTSTEVYSIFIFRTGLKYLDTGYASALSILFLVIVLLICTNLVSRTREIYEVEA